jgi:hypothetical protein
MFPIPPLAYKDSSIGRIDKFIVAIQRRATPTDAGKLDIVIFKISGF